MSCIGRSLSLLLPLFSLFAVEGHHDVRGQCILANPSFELAGSGGNTFGGWSQFGVVGATTDATHGAHAARVIGPNDGTWGVSGYWQRLDTAPGERWSASVQVSHSPSNPLTGGSRAILNVEWRDSNGNLISYESQSIADAATPAGEYRQVNMESQPAPAGTVATHFLLGVLQSPTEPAPVVLYDQAAFDNLGPPSLDELQWTDFPGGRTISFSGRAWRVKGPGTYGPGPNYYGDDADCTWVDPHGRLHLTIRNVDEVWTSSEVALEQPLGYGDYIFTTAGRLDLLDARVVFGLFLWQYGPCYDPVNDWWNPYNEIDVEFSRWGVVEDSVGQFVAQPAWYPGNKSRFDATFSDGEITSHAFRWRGDRVDFRSWRGGPWDETPEDLIHAWTYAGPHIPRPEQPRVHLNLWRYEGFPGAPQEVVIDRFVFIPDAPADVPLPHPVGGECTVGPNPFSGRTTIRFTLRNDGDAEGSIYDLFGRLVRTLGRSRYRAGVHEAVWDARDDAGRPAVSGLYLLRIRAGEGNLTRRMILVR